MENRRHHYSCPCNDCVRQRNGRRRRSADRYADDGRPLPAGSMWYEVPRDLPVKYADDLSPSVKRFCTCDTDGTPCNYCRASGYRPQADTRIPSHRAPSQRSSPGPDQPAGDGSGESVQGPGRVEPPIRYQRDDMEQERERQLQEFRRQQEERQRDWEQRRDQLRAKLAPDVQFISRGPDGGTLPPPSGGGSVPMSEEPPPQTRPMSSAASKRKSRRGFFWLLLACVLLVVIVGAGALTYAALAPSRDGPGPESLAPTPDLAATIAAAVAAAWPTQPVTPFTTSPSANRTLANAVPPPLPSDRLPTVECPACVIPDTPPDRYVEWIRDPIVSKAGEMTFRARIDEQAGFVVASSACGFENLTLTDDNGNFYGAIIPYSMSIACGAAPGDRVAETYQFSSDLLTVRLHIEPVAASHPGLTLCLWAGGTSHDLLGCRAVKQP